MKISKAAKDVVRKAAMKVFKEQYEALTDEISQTMTEMGAFSDTLTAVSQRL